MRDETKPRPLTVPKFLEELDDLLREAEALADSDDNRAASVGRKAHWLRQVRPGGV
jgi:hypothetical protein